MKVRLIAVTKGVAEAESAQDLISYVARVSSPNNQTNFETAPKLIRYLINNQHWSPFEAVYMTVEIETSRAIAAQILRHRSFCFQELSQRYSAVFEKEDYEARRQDIKNRQNSVDDMSVSTKDWFKSAQEQIWNASQKLYEEALGHGIAKEQARFLLPLSTRTMMYMTGSVRSWLHYIDLRSGNGTQKEHKDIALAIKSVFSKEFPDVAEAMWPQDS